MQQSLFDLEPIPGAEKLSGLAERAWAWGCDPLPDADALALLLEPLDARKAATWAKALIARFGSFAGAVAAEQNKLSPVIGQRAAVHLAATHYAARRLTQAAIRKRCVVSSWTALAAYVRVMLANETREQFRVLFLDKKNQLIADELCNRGTVDHAPVYVREVMRRALELDASALILVHNHPSGDPTPSGQDIDMTRQVIEAAKALKIAVHDHLVVGSEGIASFRQLGHI